jgi:uncharacterized protein (DUF3084 family)
MALSNTPKETLDTHQILLDIAQGLKSLQERPDFASLAKEAYALPAAEAAKAQEARRSIAQYQALVDEHKGLLADIAKGRAELDDQSLLLRKEQDKLREYTKSLDARDREVAAGLKKLAADALALDERAKRMDARQADIGRQEESLAARRREIDDYEAGLKARAEELRKLAGAL